MTEREVLIEADDLARRLRQDRRDLHNGCVISPFYLADICEALALLLDKQN